MIPLSRFGEFATGIGPPHLDIPSYWLKYKSKG